MKNIFKRIFFGIS